MKRIVDGIEHPILEETYTTTITQGETGHLTDVQIAITGNLGTREIYRIYNYDFNKLMTFIDHLLIRHKTVDARMLIDFKEIAIARRERLSLLGSIL